MTKRYSRILAALLATLVLAVAAWAGPFEDADKAFRAGDYKGAITLLQQAQKENPGDVRVYAALGRTYRKLGNNDAAREAYTEFLRRDPQLRTLKDDTDRKNFLNAFKAIGGKIPTPSGTAPSGGGSWGAASSGPPTSAQEIFSALNSGNVFVSRPLRGEIDASQLEAAVKSVAPVKVKIVVVQALGGYPSREAFAEDLRKRLNLSADDVAMVVTPKGVSASTGRLSNDQINKAIQSAGLDTVLANSGPTEMIATAIRAAAQASRDDYYADFGGKILTVGAIGIGVGGFLIYKKAKRNRELAQARRRVDASAQNVLKQLSFVDGYLDLLPKGDAATIEAKRLRASGYDKYETAKGIAKIAKTPDEVERALPLLFDADRELTDCRRQIDIATGGTGVAMSILEDPSLATDTERARQYLAAEELRTSEERARLQRDIEQIPMDQRGVSFFSGRPMPSDVLIPVTVIIAGQRRTVMASPEEAAVIQAGRMPPVRAFHDPSTGGYVPWYEFSAYDPYRDYYAYDGRLIAASIMMDLAQLTAVMGAEVYGHYGPWGYRGYGWGMPEPQGGYVVYESYPTYPYQQDTWFPQSGGYYGGSDSGYSGQEQNYQPEHAGGMDLFGQQDYQEQSPSFDSSDSSSSWSSSDSSSSWSSSDSSSSWSSSDSSSSSSSSDSSSFGGSSDW